MFASFKNENYENYGEFFVFFTSRFNRFFEIIYFKFSFKKLGVYFGRCSRLFCKLSDSLDWIVIFINSLDRCRSEVLEFFCDDFNIIVFFVVFDLIDFMSSVGFFLRNRLSRVSIVDYNFDIF